MSGLKSVINLYKSPSFEIKTMFMDNEFEVLDSSPKVEHITLNIPAKDENVPKIERQI